MTGLEAVTRASLEAVGDGAFRVRLHGEGRVDATFVEELHGCLDRLEATTGNACFVVTGTGERFCPGFDPEAVRAPSADVVDAAIALLARLLVFPVPSAAAVGGDALGIGAAIALACDFQCMRADRACWCRVQADQGPSLEPAMTALVHQKLAPHVRDPVLRSSRRFGGREAAALGLVDEACGAKALVRRSLARVAPLAGKDRATYGALKRSLHRRALSALEPRAGHGSGQRPVPSS